MNRPSSHDFYAEARACLKLAVPVIAAMFAVIGMGTVDTIMAGRLGSGTLAAVAVGSNVNVVFLVFFMGILLACSPIVAHRAGAGQADARVGVFVREAQLLALFLAAVWTAAAHLAAEPVLAHLGLEPDTARIAARFLRAYSWSSFGLCQWFVLRYAAEGAGVTTPAFWSGLVGLAANAVLDWIFMYGKFGLPAMGAVGCGWATTISSMLMAGAIALQFPRHAPLRALHVFGGERPVPGAGTREIIKLGLPIALILVAEAGLFSAAALVMAHFGDHVVAAYQIAINFASIAFMIPLGIGHATTVRVGHAAGGGDAELARYRGGVGMRLGLINAASNALVMLVFAGGIAAIYTNDAAISSQAVAFLWLAAAFQFFDGLQVTANGALRGIKDTRVPMLITVGAYWIVGMPLALWLAFHTPLGPAGVWWGLTAGLGVAALGLSLRFLNKAGRTKASVVMS